MMLKQKWVSCWLCFSSSSPGCGFLLLWISPPLMNPSHLFWGPVSWMKSLTSHSLGLSLGIVKLWCFSSLNHWVLIPCAGGKVASQPFIIKHWAPALLRACTVVLWQGRRVVFTECFVWNTWRKRNLCLVTCPTYIWGLVRVHAVLLLTKS